MEMDEPVIPGGWTEAAPVSAAGGFMLADEAVISSAKTGINCSIPAMAAMAR